MRKTIDEFLSDKSNYHLLIADLGFFDKVEEKNNLINVGVQESNLVNIACGLALSGVKVFIYSVSGFVIQRAYEQIKFNICQKSKNVTFLTAGAGLCYQSCGTGHYLNNDFALMASLPEVNIYAPSDKNELKQILSQCYSNNSVNYVRLGLDGSENKNLIPYNLDIKNDRIPILISTGWISNYYSNLEHCPYHIFHVPEIKKLEEYDEILSSKKNKKIVIEDHIKFGGLTTYLHKTNIDKHIYLPDKVEDVASTKEELWKRYNLI